MGKDQVVDVIMKDATLYNSLVASAVDLSQANLQSTKHGKILSFIRSARDIDFNQRRKFLHQIMLVSNNKDDKLTVLPSPPAQMADNILFRKVSPSGNKIAIFTRSSDEKDQVFIEIWQDEGSSLVNKIPISKSLHGDICFDTNWFGSINWNKDETAIVYSAERTAPKSSSFFDEENYHRDTSSDSLGWIGKTNTLGFGKGENWGEKYTSTCVLDLFVVNVETGNIGKVENVPGAKNKDLSSLNGYTLGQAIFSPDGKSIVYTAWDGGDGGQMPRRLGSIYCYQRHCALYQSSVSNLLNALSSIDGSHDKDDTDYLCITPNDRLARSPRFIKTDSSKDMLIWLSNSKGFDTHGGVMGLSMLEWESKQGALINTRRELVAPIHEPENDDSFPGLFMNQLPEHPFLSKNGRHILVNTQWRSQSRVISIDLDDGTVVPLSFNLKGDQETMASQTLLCMSPEGDAIVTQSDSNCPAVVGVISAENVSNAGTEVIKSQVISKLGPIVATCSVGLSKEEECTNFKSTVIRVHPPHGSVRAPVEGILLLPSREENAEKIPLIIVPHGGPHSCTPTSFIPSYAFLANSYAILHVNFRGSSGFGQAALESLAGTAGTQDVEDCVFLTNYVLKEFEMVIDKDRVGVCGGSHGGYLASHLIGQHPDMFQVAALRNPVTNIATMTTATDIPDWCYIETFGLGSYDWSKFQGATKEQLAQMWDASPIAYASNVKAPTLVALGNSDKRVPPSQGIEYYHSLRSKGVDTKLLMYEEDDHAIDKVKSESDHWINIKHWFDKHL